MEGTHIEWADNTFNPWQGCARVSEGCANCYAETRDKRFTGGELWGKHARRQVTSDAYWRQPIRWNARAERTGVRERVFCASLADVFERHADPETNDLLNVQRARLWELIEQTPWLDWLLLTKRPENVPEMVPAEWVARADYECGECGGSVGVHSGDGMWTCLADDCGAEWSEHDVAFIPADRSQDAEWPDNVWIGTTIESPAVFDRLDHLRAIPSRIRFVSAEPLLADISDIDLTGISWVICGGESGPGARPMHPEWARNLRNAVTSEAFRPHGQPCAFLFKQWGDWADVRPWTHVVSTDGRRTERDQSSKAQGEVALMHDAALVARVGKKVAGRLLDGRTWDEVPS